MDTEFQPVSEKLSPLNFFIHVGIIFGILDSVRASNEYYVDFSISFSLISFTLSAVLTYGFAGYLLSLPIKRYYRKQEKLNQTISLERQAAIASYLMTPILTLPVIFFLIGRLLVYPESPLDLVKNLVGIFIVVVYSRFLFVGTYHYFIYLSTKSISLWKLIFVEISLAIILLFFIGGFKSINFILNMLIGVFLVVIVFFAMRGPFSPVFNRKARFISRVVFAVLIIAPLFFTPIVSRETEGVNTVNGNGSIILITIDALRADYLPSYGSKYTETPNLNEFSKNAVVFERMYSVAPWTVSAVASLATGVYPSVHGANVKTHRIQSGIPTLAENLKERGYVTAAFFVNPLMGKSLKIDKGFDEFYESYTMAGAYTCLYPYHFAHNKIFMPLCSLGVIHYDSVYVHRMEKKLYRWIERNKDKKVFLWVHYYDPHAPYGPPKRYLTRKNPQGDGKINFATFYYLLDIVSGMKRIPENAVNCLRDLYAGDIDFADERVGLLLDKLDEMGWMKGATVIISADHGEEFFEHGSFEHGHTFYEELMHVPLYIRPGENVGEIPAGRENEPVSILDVVATIADVANLETTPYYRILQGKSIFAPMDESDADKPIFMEEPNRGFPGRIAVLKKGWKFIIHDDNTVREIYNLNEDPLEIRNLVGTVDPSIISKVIDDVKIWKAQNEALRKQLRVNPDENDEKAKLNLQLIKGLGYIK